MLKIFISYTTDDLSDAEALEHILQNNGFEVFFAPRSMANQGGENYTEPIVDNLGTSDLFLIVVSQNSMNSNEVNSELNLAFHHPKFILPVRIDRAALTGNFIYFLGSRNRIEGESPITNEILDRVVNSIKEWEKKPKTPDMIRLIIEDYIGRGDGIIAGESGLTQECSYIDVAGIGQKYVHDVYVLPTVVNKRTNARSTGRMALRTVLDCESPVVVTANAGFGKSVFSKELVLEMNFKNKENIDTLEEIVPILIDLGKEFGGMNENVILENVILNNLNKHVRTYKDNNGEDQQLTLAELKKFMDYSRTVLIFDGVDEISDNNVFDRIFNELNSNHLFENSMFIFTSRPTKKFENRQIRGKNVVEFEIEAFDDVQQEDYVRKNARLRGLSDEQIRDLLHQLLSVNNSITSNPLLLSQLINIYACGEHHTIPGATVMIYQESVNLILETTVGSLQQEAFTPLFLNKALCCLAKKHLERLDVQLDDDDVAATLQSFLIDNKGIAQDDAPVYARQLKNALAASNLYANGRFQHKTISEYFLSLELFTMFFKQGKLTENERKIEQLEEIIDRCCEDGYNQTCFELLFEQLDPCADPSIDELVGMFLNAEGVNIDWLVATVSGLRRNAGSALKEIYKYLIKNVVRGKENLYDRMVYYFSKNRNVIALASAAKDYIKHHFIDDGRGALRVLAIVRDLVVLVYDVAKKTDLQDRAAKRSLKSLYEDAPSPEFFDERVALCQLFYDDEVDDEELRKKVETGLKHDNCDCYPAFLSLSTYLHISSCGAKKQIFNDPCELCIEDNVFEVGGTRPIVGLEIVAAEKVLSNTFYNQPKLSCIYLYGVKEIEDNAFARCSSLCKLYLGDYVERIGQSAFAWDENLKVVELPKHISKIDKMAFASSGIKSIRLPETLEEIKEGVFYGCKELETVNKPASLKKIGYRAFSWCVSLRDFNLEGVEFVDDCAFTS